MPQISETPHGGGASRNQLSGWLQDVPTPQTTAEQHLPALIASHLGGGFLAKFATGDEQ